MIDTLLSSPSWTSFDPSPFFGDETSNSNKNDKLVVGWSSGVKQPSTPSTPANKFGSKSVGTATTASISPSNSTSFQGVDDYSSTEEQLSITPTQLEDELDQEDQLVKQVFEMDRMFEGPKVSPSTPKSTEEASVNNPTHRRELSDTSSWSWLEKKYLANHESSPDQRRRQVEETVHFESVRPDDDVDKEDEDDETYANSSRDRLGRTPSQKQNPDRVTVASTSLAQSPQRDLEKDVGFDLDEIRDFACTSMDKAAGLWGEVQKFFSERLDPKEPNDEDVSRCKHSPLRAALARHSYLMTPHRNMSIPRTIRTTPVSLQGGSGSSGASPRTEKRISRSLADTLGLESTEDGDDREGGVGIEDDDEEARADDVSSMTEPLYILPDEFHLKPIKYPKSRPRAGSIGKKEDSIPIFPSLILVGQNDEQELRNPLEDTTNANVNVNTTTTVTAPHVERELELKADSSLGCDEGSTEIQFVSEEPLNDFVPFDLVRLESFEC